MTSLLEKEKIAVKIKKPGLWNVILHNDDTTHFEFVIFLLVHVFAKSAMEAVAITKQIHNSGKGVAGVYPKEIAESKKQKALDLTHKLGFPLVITIEKS